MAMTLRPHTYTYSKYIVYTFCYFKGGNPFQTQSFKIINYKNAYISEDCIFSNQVKVK